MLRLPRWRLPFGHKKVGGYCVLRFPDSTESRWFDRLPTPGTTIRSERSRHAWVVDEVLQSGRNTYTVFCVARRQYRSRAEPDMAAELVALARLTRETVGDRRRRWKRRNYIP